LKESDHSEDLGTDWEDNIRMDLKEVGWEGVDWIHLAQKRGEWWALVYLVMDFRPQR
jgi:hypothetical protein